MSQLLVPCVKGDRIKIFIPEDEYHIGLEACKHNLHRRIIWPKGSTPLNVVRLRAKLTEQWTSIGKWGTTSLRKGFLELSFSCIEDVRSIRSATSWNLYPGTLKLFSWTKDFVPSNINQTSAQEYERLPDFSNYCNCIGHAIKNCKRKALQDQNNQKNKPKEEQKNVYMEKKKDIEVVNLTSKEQTSNLPSKNKREKGEANGLQKKTIPVFQDTEKLLSSTDSDTDLKFVDSSHQKEKVK
ncbi:hypothetical protein KIW84_025540 [Lathyrus oleraceus]|uniref:DUF4283 domain-containing protein n=1 Tax=Pisum sativum TaxID=3888 RepID=A0A9D4YJI3_PEA|nr:hypothetical protein KIW84_025540 [Pisum sativum]